MKLKIILNEQTPKIENYKPIKQFLKENLKLLERFILFSRTRKNCAGLASNQVAVDGKRIMQPFFVQKDRNGLGLFIHPKILVYYGDPIEMIEGCLTWPGKKIKAMRYPEVGMEYYTIRGEKEQYKVKGYKAQIWQHEYDHLTGKEEKII